MRTSTKDRARLVLASQSPRRKEILTSAGFEFEVQVAPVEEIRQTGERAADYVRRLARNKAFAVGTAADAWVVGADTTVVVGEPEVVLEKPGSRDEVLSMMRQLSGRSHEVLTGVCLRRGGQGWTTVESTKVWFRELSEAEIQAYADTGEPYDKAGGYAIQGLASRFIPRIEGCYFNVVGLPVQALDHLLREAGYWD